MMLNQDQQRALQAVKDNCNIFLTGSPGTGKSYVLKCIIEWLKTSNKRFAVTSSTGCSAILINGQTIHSYLGIGIGNRLLDNIITSLKKNRTKYKTISELQVLILDEISMIDNSTLEKISQIFQRVKGDMMRPFAGIQIIFVGDFCQLSPVQGHYCFTSDVWKAIDPVCIQLTELIRQKDDKDFQQILQEVRFGKCSSKSMKKLSELQNTIFEGIVPTKLYPLNSDVQTINMIEFNRLYSRNNKAKAASARIIDCYPVSADTIDMEYLMSDTYDADKDIFRYHPVTNDKTKTADEYVVDLFKGLQVMVTRNINIENGLINGTIGIITSLTTSSVAINVNDNIHIIYFHKDINENNNTYVKFMPIKLAYALSIHKSQGATLDAIEIDGSSNIFAAGQLYTALSRARCLSSIRLLNLDRESFICNKVVKDFYENMKK
jgi:ATP-dependent DNA helicase PIF1